MEYGNKKPVKTAKKSPREFISKHGRREDLDFRYFRSKMEANYARYLNVLKQYGEIAHWEYEPKEFEFPVKRGTRFYKPDFQVFDHTGQWEWHEVKGYMDNKSRIALKRMAIHYPSEKIVVKDAAWFKANTSRIKPLIKNWE